MNELIVIIGASGVRGTMREYLRQLATARIDFHVENLSGVPNLDTGGTLGQKVDAIRKLANQFSNYERLLFSDAFDVTFYGKRDDVIDKIPKDHVLWAAEKNCYPDHAIATQIPDSGPWRFANGGLLCGTPKSFIEWAHLAETHQKFDPAIVDQQFHNIMLAEGPSPLCVIDSRTDLFFCLYKGYEELEFENGLPVNTLYGTRPQFIHANGKWDAAEAFTKLERSLNGNRQPS